MTDILTRIMNIWERVQNTQILSQAAVAAFAVLAVFGLLNCILGYRLLRFWMMLFGFAIGAAVGFVIVYTSQISDRAVYIAGMAAMGIILAVAAFLVYRLGIFVLGAGIGLALSIYVLHPTTSAVFFLCILIGVGLGVLAMRCAREVIIVGTSILGGVTAGLSIAKIGGLGEIPYGIGMSVGFAVLGVIIQFAINKPGDDEEDEEEPADDNVKKHTGHADDGTGEQAGTERHTDKNDRKNRT